MKGEGECQVPVLEARGLSLGYGGRPVLKDVNLVVRPGEYWALLGPNGEGKSTFLAAALGLLAPLSGELWRNPAFGPVHRGFVPQRAQVFRALPMSLEEFVLLGLAGLALPGSEEERRMEGTLASVGLGGRRRDEIGRLSGGQRQRALLARALVREPHLLVLDEPTDGLDPRTRAALLETLGRLHREEGLTVLLATHDLELAATQATHVALFSGGRVEAGPRQQVLTTKAYRRLFGQGAGSGGAGPTAPPEVEP